MSVDVDGRRHIEGCEPWVAVGAALDGDIPFVPFIDRAIAAVENGEAPLAWNQYWWKRNGETITVQCQWYEPLISKISVRELLELLLEWKKFCELHPITADIEFKQSPANH